MNDGPIPRTSLDAPIRIDYVTATPFTGHVGITFCPGKKQIHAISGAWDRDLEKDIEDIVAWGASALISLMEPHEFEELKVVAFPQIVALHPTLVWCPRNNFTVKPPSFPICAEVDPSFDAVNICKAI